MKKIKLAINGFGRIGRNAFKIAFDRPDVDIVAINDLTDGAILAHLLKHDSTFGTYAAKVEWKDGTLYVSDKKIAVTAEPDLTKLDWQKYDVDVVLECTGRFTKTIDARKHISRGGAKKVVISAPAKDSDIKTIVLGVNETKLKPSDDVVSCASCTTNCITPVMSVIDEVFGIKKGMMTTIHAYTATQALLDSPAKDLRTARSAAENIIPTTTGASKAVAEVLPSLGATFGGMSVRVPVPNVSLSDLTFVLKRSVTVDEVNKALKTAAKEPFYQGILAVTEEELVSSDFLGNPASAIVDLPLTAVVDGDMVKIVAWYDNEWGYSNRLVELATEIGKATKQ